jgi:DNA-binding response OmpR family regulator
MNHPKKRILVVDDEAKITRWLRINLEQTGDYEVREENRASHALAAALEFQPDLILLDVLMPAVDGGELASQFQASTRFRDVPIVFLTAAVTREEVNSRRGTIGGLHFLAKPVDMPELIDCLQQQLRQRTPPATTEPSPTHSRN